VVEWVEARTQELQDQIAAQGGIDQIVQCILEGDKSALDYQPAQPEVPEQQFPLDPDLPGVARSQSTPGRRINPNVIEEIRRLKAMQREKAATDQLDRGSAQLAAAAVSLGNAFQENFEQGPADDNMSLMTDAQTQQVLSTLASQARESNKENLVQRQPSLLDRQANARKVPFNSQSPAKRGRDDDDDDDEFEIDSRPVKQVRRGRPPRSSLPRSTSGPSSQPQPQGQFSSSGPFASQPIPASRELMSYAAPPSTAPVRAPASPNSPLPRSSQWQEANAAAKMNAKYQRERVNNMLEPQTKIQNRKAWSQQETERLLELIALNGPAYSKILTDDRNVDLYHGTGEAGDDRPVAGVLQGRNQVQLKDKARNIKLDYLK
jgi:hypothetical protein